MISPHLRRLPDPGAYARFWKRLVAAASHISIDMGFPRGVVGRDEVLREFRAALDRRINTRGRLDPAGRKHAEMFQTELMRDAADLEARLKHRVRVYRFRCPELNKRFEHLLAEY